MNRQKKEQTSIFQAERFEAIFRRGPIAEATLGYSSGYSIVFLQAPRAALTRAGQAGEISGEHLLLFGRGDRATLTARSATLLCLDFEAAAVVEAAIATGIASDVAEILFCSQVAELDTRMRAIFDEIAEEMMRREPGHSVLIEAAASQILVHVLRRYSSARNVTGLELTRTGIVDRRIRRAVELMHSHMDQDVSLAELAAAAHLSQFHFARLFRKLAGLSPHNFLASIRIDRARRLLAESDLSITEIAARVGYAGPSHFGKAFRQSTGLSPTAFRRSLIRGR